MPVDPAAISVPVRGLGPDATTSSPVRPAASPDPAGTLPPAANRGSAEGRTKPGLASQGRNPPLHFVTREASPLVPALVPARAMTAATADRLDAPPTPPVPALNPVTPDPTGAPAEATARVAAALRLAKLPEARDAVVVTGPAAADAGSPPPTVSAIVPESDTLAGSWSLALARASETHVRYQPKPDPAPTADLRVTPLPGAQSALIGPTLPRVAEMFADRAVAEPLDAMGVHGETAVAPPHVGQADHLQGRAAPDNRPLPPPPPQQVIDAIRAAQGNQVELHMAPEELGRVSMSFQPEGDALRVHLIADRPETLDLLRRHAPELAAELRAAGYESASFSFGRSGNAPSFRADTETGESDQGSEIPAPRPAAAAPAGTLDLRL
ncbi:MAG: flagellar hook-length control protein FliK [Gemmobacter sp.]